MDYLIPEWEKQEFVQLVFPHKNTDWACCLAEAINTFTEIAYAAAQYQKVLICYEDENTVSHLKHKNFILKKIENNDTWARDFGAISIKKDNEVKLLDFKFNGWGLKYPSNFDNLISRKIFNIHKSYNFVLEGGSIDTNGKTLLTTSQCLLEPNRNYPLTKEDIEKFLKKELFIDKIIWLNHGFLEGDDTDSHIDTLARFVDQNTIIYCKCEDINDIHYKELKLMEKELKKTGFNLIPVPLPSPKTYDSHRLPATYANFLIINDAVLLPVYDDDKDKYVYDLFREIFDREIIPVNAGTLIKQHGSIHCITKEYFDIKNLKDYQEF